MHAHVKHVEWKKIISSEVQDECENDNDAAINVAVGAVAVATIAIASIHLYNTRVTLVQMNT